MQRIALEECFLCNALRWRCVRRDIIYGYCYIPQPEQELIRNELLNGLMAAFDTLTDKEKDVLSMHLGFCYECGRPEKPKTYDEIADVYQFGTEDGVRRFYQRTLDKLRSKLSEKGWTL